MFITIRATEQQKTEIKQKKYNEDVSILWMNKDEVFRHANEDAFFDLVFNNENVTENIFAENCLVFANAVSCTNEEIKHENYIRLNAWNGFLLRPVLEVSSINDEYKTRAERILDALGWQYLWTTDDYGFISARIIAMIINEAYFALEENVSNKEEIDTAMKLGTNYPYGPFEWAEKIGLKNVYGLLKKLQNKNSRYTISNLLQSSVSHH